MTVFGRITGRAGGRTEVYLGSWESWLGRVGLRRYDEDFRCCWTGGFVVSVKSMGVTWLSYTGFNVPNIRLVPQMLSLTCKLEEQIVIITSLPVHCSYG